MAAFVDPGETGRRVAELYQELSFPAPAKLQRALQKEGIAISLKALKELVGESGARQVFQPPPRYGGNITSGRIDDRWAADLLSFESKPAKRAEATYTAVLIVQDIFSRFCGPSRSAAKPKCGEPLKTSWTDLVASRES